MLPDHPTAPPPARPAERPTLAITATFTAETLEPALAFWLGELGLDWRIRFAPYNQVFQQLLDPAGLLARNRLGVNVALVRFEDWARFESQPSLEVLEENVRQFGAALHGAASALAAPLIVALCPASPAFLAEGRTEFLARMERELSASLSGMRGVHLLVPADVDRLYPVAERHDPHGDKIGRLPYTPEYFAALAALLARRIHALRTPPYKVAAIDCDDTLWAGICGEDGPQGVAIDPPRRALQEFLLARKREGLLLALASKNNEEDVVETFLAHPEMPLSLDDFVARRINWEPKAANLTELAEDLDLNLDSFILVDDNPKECTEVQAACPEVLALPLPTDPAAIPAFLAHLWAFDRLEITREDRERSALYAQQAERHRMERQASSLEEFLASLKLDVRIAPPASDELARVAQLTHRTNQMNASTVRRSEIEVAGFLRSGGECLVAHVSDRFGSYGLTGVMLFRETAAAIEADTFLLSCRALGRGVEHRMLAALGEIAKARGLARVDVPFSPTERNRPALLFLESIAGPGGGPLFRIPAGVAAAASYKPGMPAAKAASKAAAASRARTPVDYLRIATELRDPRRVLDAIRDGAQPGESAAVPADPPRSDLEAQLIGLWKELLHVPEIGVHDSFFDLGGHSLLAVQLLSRVRQAFGADLTLEVVYSGNFTVAELARAIELKELEQAGGGEYAALVAELEQLSDEEVRALLAEEEARGGGQP
jgi:FkbH-like protein